ncbi:SH3-domain kinase binding protein 1 [Chytriomyces hyalinus]|nr:SH3-domain kinase binding protein 1 [Chytriomyces hyalinus]
MASSCFQLSENSVCGSAYAGVAISPTLFASEALLDASLSRSSSSEGVSALYFCGTGAVSEVRFLASVKCAEAAFQSIDLCSARASAANTRSLLCPQQCQAAVLSLQQTLVANSNTATTQCPLSAAATAVSDTQALCSQFSSISDSCWEGVQQDSLSCGFLDPIAACAIPRNAALPCCANPQPRPSFTPRQSGITTSSSKTVSPTNTLKASPSNTSSSFSSSQPQAQTDTPSYSTTKAVLIAATTAAAAIFIACLIAFICVFLRRRDRKNPSQNNQNTATTAGRASMAALEDGSSANYQIFSKISQRIDPYVIQDSQPYVPPPRSEASMSEPVRYEMDRADDRRAKVTAAAIPGVENKIWQVSHAYEPTRSDELRLNPGHSVVIVRDFGDGWAEGIDLLSGDGGIFPLSCVTDPNVARKLSSSVPIVAPIILQREASQRRPGSRSGNMHYIVIRPYKAVLPDELNLIPGRDMVVLQSFEDGWCKGFDPARPEDVGVFPKSCLLSKEEFRRSRMMAVREAAPPTPPTNGAILVTKRMSSLDVAGGGTGAKPESTTAMMEYSGSDTLDRVRVLHAYKATRPDELELRVGGEVTIVKEFKDGWAKGEDVATGNVGMFPLICVTSRNT